MGAVQLWRCQVAAPRLVGRALAILALANQAKGSPLGFINPTL